MSEKYYTTDRIDATGAYYRMVFGMRSNGKTTAVLRKALENWLLDGKQFVYLRRYDHDVSANNMRDVWSGVESLGWVSELSEGVYDRIVYHGGKFYCGIYDEELDRVVRQSEPFGHVMALTTYERKKSTSYPEVSMIFFEEFLSRQRSLLDEFGIFLNAVSTITRLRDDIVIYMIGNNVDMNSLYFSEMYIDEEVKKMKPGDLIEVKTTTGNHIAVEYSENIEKEESDSYKLFTFQRGQTVRHKNTASDMIIGKGWEMDYYARPDVKHKEKDVIQRFFVDVGVAKVIGDVIFNDETSALYILFYPRKSRSTNNKGEHKDDWYDMKEEFIYSLDFSTSPYHSVSLLNGHKTKFHRTVAGLIKANQVFFSSNETGELIRKYINDSEQTNAIKL